MENLGIILPGEIQMLLAKKNSLLDDIMKVKMTVNTYNTFVSSMSNLEVSFYFYTNTYLRCIGFAIMCFLYALLHFHVPNTNFPKV